MLDSSYISKLRDSIHGHASKRHALIKESADALHHAKRAIFSLHRHNRTEAEEKLALAESILKKIISEHKKDPKMLEEGSFKAAMEEFVEASLFYQFVTKGKIGSVKGMNVDPGVYLAGLCDVPGELYRYAINAATQHELDIVKQCADMAEEIVGELLEINLTSYLRNKFDQAKQATHKLEFVVYELSVRRKE